MASASNAVPLVIARFLLAVPFLVGGATTFVLLSKRDAAVYELQRPLMRVIGELGIEVPEEKLAVLSAVMQGMGGFLLVFNHKFGGLLLMAYLLPMTALSHQFWKEDPDNLVLQLDALGKFLKNVAIIGGIAMFMATTDQVPLKIKRKPLE